MYQSTKNTAQIETRVLNSRTLANTFMGSFFGFAFGWLHDSIRLTRNLTLFMVGSTSMFFTHHCFIAVMKMRYSQKILDRYFIWHTVAGLLNLGLWMSLSYIKTKAVNPVMIPYYVGSVTVCSMTMSSFSEGFRRMILKGPSEKKKEEKRSLRIQGIEIDRSKLDSKKIVNVVQMGRLVGNHQQKK